MAVYSIILYGVLSSSNQSNGGLTSLLHMLPQTRSHFSYASTRKYEGIHTILLVSETFQRNRKKVE